MSNNKPDNLTRIDILPTLLLGWTIQQASINITTSPVRAFFFVAGPGLYYINP